MTFDQLFMGRLAAGIGSLGGFGRVLYDAERLEHIRRQLTHKVDRVDPPRRGHE